MKLYLIRHGESEANRGKFYSGWSDVALTAQGEQDAREAGELIRHIQFDRVYSSDLHRVIQTQQLAYPTAKCIRTPLIREFNVGSLMGHSFEQCIREYGETFRQQTKNLDFSCFGGENTETVAARIAEFMQMLEQSECENVLAFSHAGAIRCMIEYVLGFSTRRGTFVPQNGAVTVLEYKDDTWSISVFNHKKTL